MKTIGVDLGGTQIRCAAVDEQGMILQKIKEPSEVGSGCPWVINKMIRMIRSLDDFDSCSRIGIGCPGPLNAKEGIILSPINLPDWDRVPLASIIAEATNKPVRINNDANVAALAEARFGAGKGYDAVVFVTVSTGIGAGIVINQKILNGTHDCAGEIANLIVEPNGYRHSVLNPGSLEAMASGSAIARRAQEQGLNIQTTHQVFEHYYQNDPIAMAVIDQTAHYLAQGLASIAQILDPDVFALGGGVMEHADVLLPLIRKYYSPLVYQTMDQVVITKVVLQEPGLIGAALL